MWKNEAAAVRMGQRILIRTSNAREAAIWLREMANEPDMRAHPMRCMIDCKSGGFAHFVWEDSQVIGMEYHDNMGPYKILTSQMKSRVRLDNSRVLMAGPVGPFSFSEADAATRKGADRSAIKEPK